MGNTKRHRHRSTGILGKNIWGPQPNFGVIAFPFRVLWASFEVFYGRSRQTVCAEKAPRHRGWDRRSAAGLSKILAENSARGRGIRFTTPYLRLPWSRGGTGGARWRQGWSGHDDGQATTLEKATAVEKGTTVEANKYKHGPQQGVAPYSVTLGHFSAFLGRFGPHRAKLDIQNMSTPQILISREIISGGGLHLERIAIGSKGSKGSKGHST